MKRVLRLFSRFGSDTSGAVTVDFVVLCAAVVGLGAMLMTSVGSGATDIAEANAKCLNNIGRKVTNDNLEYTQALRRAGRRCSRL